MGITYKEEEDKEYTQRIRLSDQGEYIIQIDFKKEEFDLNKTFCRGISKIISRKNVFISILSQNKLSNFIR